MKKGETGLRGTYSLWHNIYELSYLGPVSERLDVDWALLQVDGVRAEVHLTTDVEVHPLGKAHHVVVVHPQ